MDIFGAKNYKTDICILFIAVKIKQIGRNIFASLPIVIF